jgi:hypothetical protein
VHTAREKRWKRIEYELLVLLRRRGREEEKARARDTAAVRWQSAVVSWARGAGMEVPARGAEGGGEL